MGSKMGLYAQVICAMGVENRLPRHKDLSRVIENKEYKSVPSAGLKKPKHKRHPKRGY